MYIIVYSFEGGGCGTIMVLNCNNTSNNYKDLYNMNTKTREKVAEILQSHLFFEEIEEWI